jgi:chromosomal replication initiator protein
MIYCLPCNNHGLKATRILENPSEILDLCCEFFGVTRKEISGKSRYRGIMFARHMSMHLLHSDKSLNLTLREIGLLFGNRDHSTIIHAIRTINKEFDIYEEVYTKAVHLHRKIYGSIRHLDLGKK